MTTADAETTPTRRRHSGPGCPVCQFEGARRVERRWYERVLPLGYAYRCRQCEHRFMAPAPRPPRRPGARQCVSCRSAEVHRKQRLWWLLFLLARYSCQRCGRKFISL